MTGSALPPIDWLQLISSFLLVIGLMAVLLVFLKRMQGGLKQMGRQIELLEQFSTGPRQKIVLVRVKDREFLLGLTANQINPLAEWPAAHPVASAGTPRATGSDAPSGSTPSPTITRQLSDSLPAAKALARFLNKS